MKASLLLEEIRENIKNYNIDYLKNKAVDNRYNDPLARELARYNSEIYDEIYNIELSEDFKVNDRKIQELKNDIDFYFSKYNPHDSENQNLIKYISLYLAFIALKPLHPYGDSKSDVFIKDNIFYCKGRANFIKEKNSLCKYCCCKNFSFNLMF